MFIQINAQLSTTEKMDILQLWNQEYPTNIALKDLLALDIYLASLQNPAHFLIKGDTGTIIAWATTFERANERWFALIIQRAFQGKGIGNRLLHKIQEQYTQLNGWIIEDKTLLKADGSLYITPLDFYQKNHFKRIPHQHLSTENIRLSKIQWNKS